MNGTSFPLDEALRAVDEARLHRLEGRVTRIVGLAVESRGPAAAIGEECEIRDADDRTIARAQVVGFSDGRVFSMPTDRLHGITTGSRIVALGRQPSVAVGDAMLGRVFDADGEPLDDGAFERPGERRPLEGAAPGALARARIDEPFHCGVRSIDALLTLGRGQRVGIFAGSGVGKSTLLGMLARHARADVVVLALVGERGREVRDFIERELGEEGMRQTVAFVATSDEPPLRRIRAALAATAAAEHFRDRGLDVVLLMDSITRVAMAQREVGLSLGEPPSTKGYPPSVFSLLPRLLERAGAVEGGGSITGLYTVYVEGDDLNDPVADAARSLLDGHVVLSRELADRAHYPAVDVLASVSRLMPQVTDEEHRELANRLRGRLAALRENEDLVLLGAYHEGSDPRVDAALRAREATDRLLQQACDERSDPESTLEALRTAVASGDVEAEVAT